MIPTILAIIISAAMVLEYNTGRRGGRLVLAFHPNLNSNALAAP